MITAKSIILKDKEAFEKHEGIMRLLGKPIDIAKKLKEGGSTLLHINDRDAANGLETNFDVYDKLTYIMNIQVECNNEKFIRRLLKINARVVIDLPIEVNLKKFADKKRLLVGKIKKDYDGSVEDVHDLIIEEADLDTVKKYVKSAKRILVYKKDFKKEMEGYVFAVIG